MVKKRISGSHLIYKYGSDIFMTQLKDHFNNYEDDQLKLKTIFSLQPGVYKFEFFIKDDHIHHKIKDVEQTYNRSAQKEIFDTLSSNFSSVLMDYINDQVDKEIKILYEENKDKIEYIPSASIIKTFQYMKQSGLLRFETIF